MRLLIAGMIALAVVLAGCGGGKPGTSDDGAKPAAAGTAQLPAELTLAAAPAEPKDVKAAKADSKEGDEIVLRGRVGGTANHTFSTDRAILTIVDMSLKPCGVENKDDDCPTPWDYCCDPQEVINENMATVQVAGADGKPLKGTLKGVNGIDHMSVLVIKGKVGKRDDPKILVVNATGIFVEKAK